MKKIILSILIILNLLIGLNSQVIKDADLSNAVLTIENFLNNSKYDSIFEAISVHKWNPHYHNGYETKGIFYKLNTIPYKVLNNVDVTQLKGRIEISTSSDNKNIIVVLMFNNTYYAFYTQIEYKKGKYKILKIPYGLHEGD